jgi:NADH:ubiquinone oxidoreductase subunit 4 (subunit M)
LVFVFLTTFILPICYGLVTENERPYKEVLMISIIGSGANLAFLSIDLILFFIGFEAALIPIYM